MTHTLSPVEAQLVRLAEERRRDAVAHAAASFNAVIRPVLLVYGAATGEFREDAGGVMSLHVPDPE